MIELKVTGCCKECRFIDLDLDYLRFDDFIGSMKKYVIHCAHESVCGKLEKERFPAEHEGDGS